MAGTTFSHPAISQVLVLNYAPTEVDWTYTLNTSETPTYAGQVVQILSVNFESFSINGQFGSKEAQQDYTLTGGNAWVRNVAPQADKFGKFGPGLTQMTEWFKQYFAIASQGVAGGDSFNQQPVTITYQGTYNILVDDDKKESVWKVYPTSFPSYKISNDNFAPMWKVDCQVFEAPSNIIDNVMDSAINNLQYAPLYQPGSKWSDPFPSYTGTTLTQAQLRADAAAALAATNRAADLYMLNLPAYTPADVDEMILQGFSTPATTGGATASQTGPTDPFITGSGVIGTNVITGKQVLPGRIPIPGQPVAE